MQKRLFQLFEIFAVVALVLFLFQVAEARQGSGCICYYASDCEFDDRGIGYRYQQCTGSCYAYSGWTEERRCQAPYYPYGRT